MHAVIMAGGEGTRLRPLTSNQPKPMVPILNKPVMEYIVELVKHHGITDCVATLYFLPQLIKNYFGEGEDYGVRMYYAVEEVPLGTAGSVANASHHLSDTFIVISGDAITDIDLTALVAFHRAKSAVATLALKRVADPLEFGVVVTSEDGAIERFLEKPTWGEVFSDTINTGIYVLEPELLERVPDDEPFDFSKDLFPQLLKEGKPLYGYVTEDYWCDIGSLEQYVSAQRDILDGKTRIEPPGLKMSNNVWVAEGAQVEPGAHLADKVVIGQYARVEAGAKIFEYSVIGDNVTVQRDAHVHRSIIWESTFIGANASIHGAVVGKNCDLKAGASVDQGAVVGDECIVEERARIGTMVRVYPFKRIEAGAQLNQSLIWEARARRALFGKLGVSGLINVDITPELALRLAMAYGAVLPKGSSVVMSRDQNRAARMVKRALVAGLTSTGVSVRDLLVAPIPVTRFTARETRCQGGVHVNVSPFDPESLEIHFFTEEGIDIGPGIVRSIERSFFRHEFRRAFFDEIGEIMYPPRAREYYARELMRHADVELIRKRRFKLVVDHSYGSSSYVLPDILGRLECDLVQLSAFTNDERSTISSEELEMHMGQLARTVTAFGADLGVLIDSASERLFLVDEQGVRVASNRALLLFLDLVARLDQHKGALAVPVSFSSKADEIARRAGRKVRWTKVSRAAIMAMALHHDVIFVGSQGGGFIFARFLPAYDAMMSTVKLLELLAIADAPLSKLVGDLPEVHLAERNLYCPWKRKAAVMRYLSEQAKLHASETVDGVKLFADSGWTMVIPDDEEPIVRMYAEGSSDENAVAHLDRIQAALVEIIAES